MERDKCLDDAIWISRELKGLFRPQSLPKEVSGLPTLIKYPDGVELRKICNFIRSNQWGVIGSQKLQFRDEVWKKMRIERIPPGKLRNNFNRTFGTYLPTINRNTPST